MAEDGGERFNFVLSLHMKLARGGCMYVYRCDDFGIQCSKHRASRDVAQTVTWSVDDLEGETFDSLADAVAALRDQRHKTAASAAP